MSKTHFKFISRQCLENGKKCVFKKYKNRGKIKMISIKIRHLYFASV